MKALIDSIGRGLRHPAGTVVHVGAGTGAVIEDYRSLNPTRLLLLEGDPDSAAALREHAAAEPVVEVFGDVVARRDMSLHWYRYTLASVNGPVDRSDLVRFYPRLRLLGTQPLKAVAFDRWLAQAVGELDDEHSHVLVMDVPGQEAALLQALPQTLLERFEAVVLKGCAPSVPDGVVPAAFAAARLRERSFEALGDSDDADPLWPVSAWRFDVQGAEMKRLRASVVRLKEQEQQYAEREQAQQRRYAVVEAERDELKVSLERASRRANEAEASAGEREHQLQTAQRERDEALTEARQRLLALEAERDELKVSLERASRRANEAEASAGEREHQLQGTQRERDKAQTALTEARQRLLALEDELRNSQRALNAAVRAQALRENDLQELQERYAALMRDQGGTQELLTKLTDRLTVAHRYYEELALAAGRESMPATVPTQERVQAPVESAR